MGESFAVNAVFIKTKDTFQLGTIVNMNTMQVVKDPGLANQANLFGSSISFITKPCYEKSELDISPASFIDQKITLTLPAVSKEINDEMNAVFNNSYLYRTGNKATGLILS